MGWLAFQNVKVLGVINTSLAFRHFLGELQNIKLNKFLLQFTLCQFVQPFTEGIKKTDYFHFINYADWCEDPLKSWSFGLLLNLTGETCLLILVEWNESHPVRF